nr:hypothetical protein GCM10025732_23130 [Glycomyces mayteni]
MRPDPGDEALQERLEVEVRGPALVQGLHDHLGLAVDGQLVLDDVLAVVEALPDDRVRELLLDHGVADQVRDEVVDEGLAAHRFRSGGLQFGEGRLERAVVVLDHADEIGVLFCPGHRCLLRVSGVLGRGHWVGGTWSSGGTAIPSWGREGRRELRRRPSPGRPLLTTAVRSGSTPRGRR